MKPTDTTQPPQPETRNRASGILLHPTSLPGPYGIGELGDEAHDFLRFLAQAGQRRWQVLPLGPTGLGDSPYQSFSAFAGNALLISTDQLHRDGLLTKADLANRPAFPANRVDYPAVIPYKQRLLRLAFQRARDQKIPTSSTLERAPWLADYALFMALKDRYKGKAWTTWPTPLAQRDAVALASAREELADDIAFYRFCQERFFADWETLHQAARKQKITIIGDIPIFVAHDSADVWTNQEAFQLDRHGKSTRVAGVPPDYFSANGQLWGNPLYHWGAMAKDNYAWWIERLRMASATFDLIRIDHFRGFVAYWSIPASHKTAKRGHWVSGPGAKFFAAVEAQLGHLPIIAEDLGIITKEVTELRKEFRLPGMAVLQFAPSGPENVYLPHHYEPKTVVYTGTHDNDTTRGWWTSTTQAERRFMAQYLDRRPTAATITWQLIRLAFSSVADTAMIPLQDLLNLGSAARLNTPGTASGNWAWRYDPKLLTPALAQELLALTKLYSRTAG